MKSLATVVLLLINVFNVCSQTKEDQKLIYTTATNIIRYELDSVKVVSGTKKSEFIGFNFQDISNINTSSKAAWNQHDWKMFLSHVNLANVVDGKIPIAEIYLLNTDSKKEGHIITFTPILFSEDGNKAFLIAKTSNFKNSSISRIACYFIKRNSSWGVADFVTFDRKN